MASKAKALNDLIINKNEGLDVCIWKLMADRVGRTKSEIADELIPHGFNRKQIENRAESLMRGGKWFERDEIKSRGITKYILRRECRMPTSETGSAPEQQPQTEERGKHRRPKSAIKTAMQEALEKAVKNTEQKQTELPINPEPAAPTVIETETKATPQPDLKNGLSSTIWDVMADFKEYTREEIIMMMESLGANPATARLRLKELENTGWFDVRQETKEGKKTHYYTLRTRAMRPLEEKPYRPQVKKQGEPVKAENKQDIIAGTSQNEDLILAQAVWDTIIENPNEITPIIAVKVEEKTGISAQRARGMILDMAPKYLNNTELYDTNPPRWYIPAGLPLPEEFGGKPAEEKPYQRVFTEDEIEKAVKIVKDGLVPNAPYRLGTLRNFFENGYQCSMSDSEVETLINILVEKNELIYVGGEIDQMYMLPPVIKFGEIDNTVFSEEEVSKVIVKMTQDIKPNMTLVYSYLKAYFTDTFGFTFVKSQTTAMIDVLIERKVLKCIRDDAEPTNRDYEFLPAEGYHQMLDQGGWVYLDQEATAKVCEAISELLQDDGKYSIETIDMVIGDILGDKANVNAVKQLLVQNGVMEVVLDGNESKFTKPASKDPVAGLAGLDKNKLEQFANQTDASTEPGFIDTGLPASAQISDLELDLWQKLALAQGSHPFEKVRQMLNNFGYDDTEIDAVLEEDKKYFIQGEGGTYTLPTYMTTGTITKEKIIDFKKRADRLAGRIEQGQQAQIQQALEQAGAQNTFTSGDVKSALEELGIPPQPQPPITGLNASAIARGTGYSIAGALSKPKTDDARPDLKERVSARQAMLRNLDHALWRIFSDREAHLMSDVVDLLRGQNFEESVVRDRIMLLASNNWKVLNTVKHPLGMAFQMATGVNPVMEGEDFTPNNYVDTLIPAEGFIRCVWRLLSNGRVRARDEIVSRLEQPGFSSDWSKKMLNRMIEEKQLMTIGDKLKLADDFHLPPLPVNPTSLNVNEGIDRNLWLLCADRNWHDVRQLTVHLNAIGYRTDRVMDHLARQMDRDGFLERDFFSNLNYAGRSEIVRLKAGAQVPDRQIPQEDERRQPHSAGFHHYVGGEQAPKQEQGALMLEVVVKIFGQSITLQQLFQLGNELFSQGFGKRFGRYGAPKQNTPWGTTPMLQTTHTLFGQQMTNEQLDALAEEIYKHTPIGFGAPVNVNGHF
jgi:hypothetical protein